MSIHEIADRMMRSGQQARAELEKIRLCPVEDRQFIEDCLRNYVAIRMMLNDEEISDNITKMVRFQVSRSLNISVEELESMDQRGRCGSAPAVLSERIQIFIETGNSLGVKIPPEKTPKIQTVQDLAAVLLPLLADNADERSEGR